MSLRDYLWIALVAAMALGAWKLHHDGYASGVAHQVAKDNAAQLKASEQARAKELAQAEKFHAIAQQYEQDKADAQAKADRTIANLRAGNLRLRDQWATQRLATEVATSASQPNAATNGCAGIAIDLFRAIDPIVQRQDDQIRRLQEVLRAERQ